MKEDYLPSIRISEWAKMKGLKINTSTSINPVLKKLGLDKENTNSYNKKKINGSSIVCWFGIKEK